jgi:hypothetical protein
MSSNTPNETKGAVHQHTLNADSKAAVSALVLDLAPGDTATDMADEHTARYTSSNNQQAA